MVTEHNIAEYLRKLQEFIDRFDINKVKHAIGTILVRGTVLRFNKEEDPEGNKWEKLKDSTLKEKLKTGKTKILVRENFLRGSISYQTSKKSVKVGDNVDYSLFHQYGTRYMVARRIYGVSNSDVELINATLKDMLKF